jgi:UDPglucose 6-dehydrogenase
MKIAVIGTGYVGLVTGSCLAYSGHQVTCIDIDEAKIATMQAGNVPIYEPGLETIFKEVLATSSLTLTTNLGDGVADAEVIFLALPTPSGADGSADLSAVLSVAEKLGPLLAHYTVIVNKSTVPVGTGEKVAEKVQANAAHAFDIVSNPEFLREGRAVEDFMHPDRIVIGAASERAAKIMELLYASFITDPAQIVTMDIRSSEMTKYAANSFLAMKVSFMNEMANLCEKVGANVDSIRLGIGPDKRIGEKFLYAGIGYGGSCFPKDIQALLKTSTEYDYRFRLLESIIEINQHQKVRLVEKLVDHYNGDLTGKHLAIWGLAFKPDTDDVRESPAIYVINRLLELGASVTGYDPKAIVTMKKYYAGNNRVTFSDTAYDATTDADALLVITEWDEFKHPDFATLKSNLKTPTIFDGRNMYVAGDMQTAGFYYESIGRPASE